MDAQLATIDRNAVINLAQNDGCSALLQEAGEYDLHNF